MKKYEVLKHTADLKIKVQADNLTELFENAVLGMLFLAFNFDLEKTTPETSYNLKIESINQESLLIEFLNKILYILEVEKNILYEFKFAELTENNLLAEAKGIKLDSFKKQQVCEIKAATYHNIKIKRKRNLWETEIVFDV